MLKKTEYSTRNTCSISMNTKKKQKGHKTAIGCVVEKITENNFFLEILRIPLLNYTIA